MKRIIYLFYFVLFLGMGILLARSGELQLIRGDYYRWLAEGNRVKEEKIPAPRGIIYDRKGSPLVRNVPIYRRKDEGCVDQEFSEKQCFYQISRDEFLKMEAKGEGEKVRIDIGREYIYGEVLAHALGYLTEASVEEVSRGDYNLGDLVGRGGIEEEYDLDLRGKDGIEIFETNSEGQKIRQLGIKPAVPGKDLKLNLDAELSKVAWRALEGKKGAAVLTEAKTGKVLVLVSSPSFDPNIFTIVEEKKRKKAVEDIFSDPKQPLFNRAIAGLYPPGSTFKIVSAAAGLEEGKINGDFWYEDKGEIRVGDYVYKNWYFTQYGKTEGEINVVKALKRSTDTFFYKLGEMVGPSKLAQWAYAFGLGKKTGIDLPGEAEGKVPDPTGQWFLGNTYHFAIGQGDLLTTPLQINMMTSVIANNGKLCRPLMIQDSKLRTKDCRDLQLKSETINLIKEGMKEACSPGGTAFPLFGFNPPVACKTGTAEFGDPQNRTHAWLTAFAPIDDPQIVATVLVEAGGEGASAAAPVVKEIFESWFRGN